MVLFLSDRTVWVDDATAVARQYSKTADVWGDWCSLIWVQRDFGRILYKKFGLYKVLVSEMTALPWFSRLLLCAAKFDFPFSTFIIRIILPKKTLFIETLQLVTSLLAVTIGWKCLTLGWCDKSMKMWIAQESVRNFPSNGWLQNHFIKAPLPSRVMCE